MSKSKTILSAILLMLLLTGMLTLAFNVQKAKATYTGDVHIRADGNVDPPTAPISSVDNVTYTLNGNIESTTDGIVVERSNVTLDGAGYLVNGTKTPRSTGYGITITGVENVTVINMNIMNFSVGIYANSFKANVTGNNVTNNDYGILLNCSSKCSIVGNTASRNTYSGIMLNCSSDYASIRGNNVTINGEGISLIQSSYNDASANSITLNKDVGIDLYDSSNHNVISGNDVENDTDGIRVDTHSNLNNVLGNTVILNNGIGIWLNRSSNYNSIGYNNLTSNDIGVALSGINLGEGSVYNGIYKNDIKTNPNAGVFVFQSDNNTLGENNITQNGVGILAFGSLGNYIVKNNITANTGIGVDLWESGNNIIIRNAIADSGDTGLSLNSGSQQNIIRGNTVAGSTNYGINIAASTDNCIVYNNFIANGVHAGTDNSANLWNSTYPNGGNYWDNQTSPDTHKGQYQNETGADGIVDTPYVVDTNDNDSYPLVQKHAHLKGDVNDDGKVNLQDVFLTSLAFGQCRGNPGTPWNPICDENNDGRVNLLDYYAVATSFGSSTPTP